MIKRQDGGRNWMRRDLVDCTVPRTFLWGSNEGRRDGRMRNICDDMGKAYKTVVIISADNNQTRDGFYNDLRGSGRKCVGRIQMA